MNDEKCFCHFGGYAVKDAYARSKLSGTATIAALGAPIQETSGEDGFGTCIVMHDADNCIVFDFGNDEGATLDKYLQENGIRKIDAIYISHFHSDHFQLGTLESLIANYEVNNVVFPHAALDWDRVNQFNAHHYNTYMDAKSAVEAAAINCIEPREEGAAATYGEFVVTCHNVSETFLGEYFDWLYDSYYTQTEHEDYNNFCMVNVVSFRGHKIVVTGDIMEPAQKNMVDVLSMADLVFVPHHGLDLMISHDLINRLTAKHAVVNSNYDPDGYLTKTSNAFAGELIRSGCRVTTTYSPLVAVNAVYSIGLSGITPIEPGVLAGNNIHPCILKPGADLDTLPDGEFITYSEDHAGTILNKPAAILRSKKFKVKTETTGTMRHFGERCQTIRTVDTSATPQIAYRNMVTDVWCDWACENPAMMLDVEYRTTEYWNEKPVFKKLISYTFDEPMIGEKYVGIPHGIADLGRIISVRGCSEQYLLPYIWNDQYICVPNYGNENITMYMNLKAEWAAGRKWFFEISYIKA